MGVSHGYQRCFKAIFNILVLSFYGTISGGVVSRTESDFHPEAFEDILEEVGDQGIAIVGHSYTGQTIP